MTSREAVDALANYFGVPLNDGELRAHQHAGLPSWICYHKSQKQAYKEYFSLGYLDTTRVDAKRTAKLLTTTSSETRETTCYAR